MFSTPKQIPGFVVFVCICFDGIVVLKRMLVTFRHEGNTKAKVDERTILDDFLKRFRAGKNCRQAITTALQCSCLEGCMLVHRTCQHMPQVVRSLRFKTLNLGNNNCDIYFLYYCK